MRRDNLAKILNVLLNLNLTLTDVFNCFGVQMAIVSILFDTIRTVCDIDF